MKLLDLILPVRCVVCGAGGEQLCPACRGALPRLAAPLCARCGAPTAWPVQRCRECAGRRLAFASARAAVAYDPAVRQLVRAWKERGLRALAAVAADAVADAVAPPAVAALAFVPTDRARGLERGHHPAERLARELGERWSLPVPALLGRTRPASRQRGLALADRRRNVSGAFAPACESPARVALVDDVYTSGSTANAAASALRKAGARRVEVITFARVVR
ncbi:MAG TPA: double zinc ribbon domain-containing protein [Gaiellaceae bacterium]|nr:double zinc ribbon domain-containing protein [Gaiellaceae bacterium]